MYKYFLFAVNINTTQLKFLLKFIKLSKVIIIYITSTKFWACEHYDTSSI